MHRTLRTIPWILALALVVPGMADAAREGRLIGKVLDEAGEPVEGVFVTATAPSIPDYLEEDTTDRRGIFKVDFPERNVIYSLQFMKAGFATMTTEIDWELAGTARQEFTLPPEGMVEVGAPEVASTSNEAIQAYNAGIAALKAEDWAAAESKLREAVEHDPELPQAWTALALAHFEQEQHQQAAEAAEEAVALGATNEALLRVRWEAYRELGDEEKAAAALEDLKATEHRVEQAKDIYNQAVALFKAGDKEAALAKFQDASELDPELQEALEGLATTAFELGKNAAAVDAAEAILKTDPDNEAAIRVRYNAALALGEAERIVDALLTLAKVEFEVARNGLLRLAFEAYDASDMELARARFEKVLQVDPDHALTHYYLGLINVNLGAKDAAVTHLERFLELAPDHSEAATAADLLAYLRN